MKLWSVLFIVFVVLKLTDVIDWSWWWVTAPLWVGWAGLGLLVAFGWLSMRGFAALDRLGRGRTIKLSDEEGIDP